MLGISITFFCFKPSPLHLRDQWVKSKHLFTFDISLWLCHSRWCLNERNNNLWIMLYCPSRTYILWTLGDTTTQGINWQAEWRICGSVNYVILDRDNGLVLAQRQAVIWILMLTYCPFGPKRANLSEFWIKIHERFHSRKSFSKCGLQNGSHFGSVSMCKQIWPEYSGFVAGRGCISWYFAQINCGILVIYQTRCLNSMTPGPRLNIKTVLSTYGDFHVKDKTAVRTSYL